jgi:Flp pilus assembly protein TadD
MASIVEMLPIALQAHSAGYLNQAEQIYQQILEADPGHAEAHHMLGVLAYQTGRFDLACRSIQNAIALNPSAGAYHSNLGLAQEALGDISAAIAAYKHALQIQPNHAEAYNNLANALLRKDMVDEAIAAFQKALQIRPTFAEVHYNLGNVYEGQQRFDEALTCYQETIRLLPSSAPLAPVVRWNHALLRLLVGDFEQGWPEYEWRCAQPGVAQRFFDQPRWDGTTVQGRTILLFVEQGLGDTLLFIRFANEISNRGAKVIVECQPSLMPLLAGVAGIDRLVAQGTTLPSYDLQAPLLSVPGILHTNRSSIPSAVPYLRASPKLRDHWRGKLSGVRTTPSSDIGHRTSDSGHFFDFGQRTSNFGSILRVGIAWQGSPTFPRDRQRSIHLKHFARLTQVPGIELISLQKGPGVEQLRALPLTSDFGHRTPDSPVIDLGSDLDEASGAFMDTAAIMESLDLVISSDTSIPHLAGALAIPVWVALSWIPDWRWLLEREDSPWYPTIRLFRQTRRGLWEDVFDRIAHELARLLQV